MANYTFVTTFSKDGFETYGRQFVTSFLAHAPSDAQLVVYHENQADVGYFDSRLTWLNLDADPDREKFIQDWGRDPDKIGTPADPNSQAIRFCHKVFALTHAAHQVRTPWMVWCDADVVFHADMTEPMREICAPGKDVAYLGRLSAPYTECGFVAYRVESNPVKLLVDDMRDYYVSGRIFDRPRKDWHDSRCFDIALESSNIPHDRRNNLSEGVVGWHVWPETVLAQFSTHQKGPARKKKHYGAIVD